MGCISEKIHAKIHARDLEIHALDLDPKFPAQGLPGQAKLRRKSEPPFVACLGRLLGTGSTYLE